MLGDGRYLMGPRSYSTDLQPGSTGVFADTGASSVGMAAFPGRTLDINCPVSLAGVDLTVGSATSMTTVYGSTVHRRYNLMPTGTVYLDGNVTAGDLALESGTLYMRGASTTAGDVTVNAGTLYMYGASTIVDDVTVNAGNLYIGDGTGDAFNATGNVTVNGGWARLNNIAPAGSKVIDGNVVVNNGGTFHCANRMNVTDALLDGLITSDIIVNDGGQLRMDVNYAANGGVGPFVVTQKITITGDAANSPDDAQLWHDIQGSHSGPREVHYTDVTLAGGAVMGMRESDGVGRATLTLAGNATLTEDGDANDFDLTGVASSGGQYTLALGQTVTFNSTLRGGVDADTTLDLTNASFILGSGGQIDGSLIARSGSSFVVPGGTTTTIGGDLGVLAGSTVNFTGASVTVAGLLSGDGVITGPVTVSGSVGPGTSPGTLTTGSLTLLDASHLFYELDAPGGGGDLISVQGDLDVDDGTVIVDVSDWGNFAYGTYTLITYTGSISGDASNFVIGAFPAGFVLELLVNDSGGAGGTVQLTSTPEPSTLLLLLLGVVGLFGCVRKRRK